MCAIVSFPVFFCGHGLHFHFQCVCECVFSVFLYVFSLYCQHIQRKIVDKKKFYRAIVKKINTSQVPFQLVYKMYIQLHYTYYIQCVIQGSYM